jgi:hypothetical protein
MMNGRYLAGVVAMCGLLLLGITTVHADEDPAKKFAGKKADATLIVDEDQMGYMIMGTLGGGTLDYQGKKHKFKMGGLGVGGMGIDKLKATGEAYEMNDLKDFAGEYVDARIGFAATKKGKGDLWLKNDHGVYLHLKSHLEGIALTLGADAITVKMGDW